MNALFALIVTSQTHVVIAPGLPKNSENEIVVMVQELRKEGSKDDLHLLRCVQGSERNSIPAEFQAFADKYCEEILGAKPTLKWRGYLNPIHYKGVRDDKFMIATAYNTMLVKGQTFAIYFSNLGACIMIQGIGVDVQTSPAERATKLLREIQKSTTFEFDSTKFEPVAMPVNTMAGSFMTIAPRYKFAGQPADSDLPNKWWNQSFYYSNTRLTIIRTNSGPWTLDVFKPKGLSPLFRKPNTNLSPLDEKFWKN